jgi:bacterioferritin
VAKETKLTRQKLIDLLNEDLAREYQAIIAYVVYSQVLKGAEYMSIADELVVHAGEELQHAITLANQIDYLGGMPKVTPKPKKPRICFASIWITRMKPFATIECV